MKGKLTIASSTDSGKSSTVGDSKSSISDDDWKKLDLRVVSARRLCLAKNILKNVHGIFAAKRLSKKLKKLYQAKSISNQVYLKK